MESLTIEKLAGAKEGVGILKLSGPFTLNSIWDFQSVTRAATDAVLIVDLTAVPFMDSAALGSVMGVHVSCQRAHRKYALVGVSDRINTLFQVAGVDKILVQYPSVSEATAAL